MATAVVVILAGAAERLATLNENVPPKPPVVVLRTLTVACTAVLVKVQVICAAGNMLAAAMVNTLPAREPKLAGFPVNGALASTQAAEVTVKLVGDVSLIWTAALAAVAGIAVGEAGVAVAAAVVVMAAGVAERPVAAKLNGPPNAPEVIFCTATVGSFTAFVNVHTILAKGFRIAEGIVRTLPDKVPKLAGLPVVPAFVSVQVAADTLKLALAVSVTVTLLAVVVTVTGAGVAGAGVAATVVVIAAMLPVRFVAENVNGPPAAPVVTF